MNPNLKKRTPIKYQHFLITVLNPEYEQLMLFNSFCYPSVVSQKNNNFEWLVLIQDKNYDLKNFHKYMKPNLYPKVIGKSASIYTVVKNHIEERIDKDTKWVISTKLKPNYCIHENFISKIQNEFNAEQCLVNPVTGLIYDMHCDKCFQVKLNKNRFKSLIEPVPDNGKLKSVYAFDEKGVKCTRTWKRISNDILWLEFLPHDELPNTTRMKRVFPSNINGFNYRKISRLDIQK